MCYAVPIAVVLLVIFAAGSVLRVLKPSSPNADLLVSLLDSVGGEAPVSPPRSGVQTKEKPGSQSGPLFNVVSPS